MLVCILLECMNDLRDCAVLFAIPLILFGLRFFYLGILLR